MTPKEKAIELVNKFKNASFNCTDCDMPYCNVPCTQLNTEEAKQCALIAVDFAMEFTAGDLSEALDKYLLEVKQEIEKL